jgi:hypothetical protein
MVEDRSEEEKKSKMAAKNGSCRDLWTTETRGGLTINVVLR